MHPRCSGPTLYKTLSYYDSVTDRSLNRSIATTSKPTCGVLIFQIQYHTAHPGPDAS